MDLSDFNDFDLYPEIPKMTDSELAAKLREMNFNIGPVNNFTRSVYARKLERVLLEQTSLEHILTPGKRPGNARLEKDSPGEMYIEEEDVTACKGSIQTTDTKEGFAHSTPSLDMTTLPSKEKFGSMKTIESSDNIIKSFPIESDDVNVPPSGRQGKRQHLSTGYSESSGVFSSAAAAGQAPKSLSGLQNDMSHVRQRSAASNSDEVRNAKSYETHTRSELKPEDVIPSPRPPLQSYLQRVSTSSPLRSDDLVASSLPSARVSKTQNLPELVSWWSWAIAVVVIIALVLLLLLLVVLNMEGGYNSPV